MPRPGFIAGAILSLSLIACRLTAGPPVRVTPTPPTAGGTAAIQILPATPPQAGTGRTAQTITPLSPPTQTPRPTLAGELPGDLPRIQPGNFNQLRPLSQLESSADRPVADFAFSPGGQFLAVVACDQGITLWDAKGGQQLPTPTLEEPAACQGSWKLVFSPAGFLLASTANTADSQHMVQLWTVSSAFGAQPLHSLPAGPKPVTGLAFSPDGRVLAAGTQENEVKLWFITDPGDPLATPITELGILPLSDWAVDVEFSPDGRWLAAGTAEQRGDRFEPAVHLWRVQDLLKAGARQASVYTTLVPGSGPLRQVRFSPDGRLLAAAGDGLTLWESEGEDVGTGQENEESSTARWIERTFQEIPVEIFDFSPDGALLATGGQELLMWDLAAGLASGNDLSQAWTSLDQGDGEILKLTFAPESQSLAALSVEGIVTFWGIGP